MTIKLKINDEPDILLSNGKENKALWISGEFVVTKEYKSKEELITRWPGRLN